MDLPSRLLEFSREHRIKIYEQSYFEKDSNVASGSKDDHITTYVAHVSNDPGSRVMIKKLMRTVEGSLLALHSKDRELVEERMWTYFKRECRVWNLGGEDHPNIVKFFGVMKQADDQIPAFVTQLASYGNLCRFIMRGRANSLELSSKMKLMCDVANGLSFLHKRGVVHRDLKASNIMLDQYNDGTLRALIGDFGTAKDLEDLQVVTVQNSTNMASLAYCSPEQLLTPHVVDGAKDIWSFGCITLELLTCSIGVWPSHYSRETIQYSLEDGNHPLRPPSVPEADKVWLFISSRCWCKSPAMRIPASQIPLELMQSCVNE